MSQFELLYQTHSPFARKVLVFIHEIGLLKRVRVVHQETSPLQANDEVSGANPLGAVPVLKRPEDAPLFDSDVICQFLDEQHDGPRLIPTSGEERWRALRLSAAAQGLAQAGIALRWERLRRPPELRYTPLAAGFEVKLRRTYDWLEECAPDPSPGLGQISLATTLSWLEFRDLPDFRRDHPRLSEWLDQFSARPSMLATPLSGETID